MASAPRSEAEPRTASAHDSGEFEALAIDSPRAADAVPQQNGQQHTAIDVSLGASVHEEPGYTRKERKAEEQAGLLKGQSSSSATAGT